MGCSSDDGEGEPFPTELVTNLDGESPLSDLDPLIDGAPGNDKLPSEGKADAVYPDKFSELVAVQSPVKSQGRRGVCSIFGAVALMEHLYLKEGTIPNVDFSEQFLQWSTKKEYGSFKHTSGSNASVNLGTIYKYGIVMEDQWPYETAQWNGTNDPDCDPPGDDDDNLPTKCYTNGDPPAAAMAASRWHLPRGRWINSRGNSIKSHMYNKKQGVVVGMTFFYQSWNHRKSPLTTNQEYWRKGYVTYPNAKD